MGVINQLSVEISNKIAAGEVVERPASVVKELVENAIDAGANVISVEIEHGGASFIRITDNGCGMTAEDAGICFLRHATSKIKTADDLDAIFTLGFRGEAMSSIGAVSRVELFTKRPQDDAGTAVTFYGGELISCEQTGAADGTTIVVRDLFYNTPARMKFLKKDATEAGYISEMMTRFILSHPEISFRLIKDGKEQYFTPGDSSLVNAVYAVYGRDYAKASIEVDYEMDSVRVTGVVGKGEAARANRGYQSYFVNKRYIKNPIITRAVEDAYKNQIMIGKFPMAALNIELDPQNIDINVHPTKLEVKFSEEQSIYRAVYHAVKNAIYALPQVPEIERVPEPEAEEKPQPVIPREATGWESAKMPSQRGGFGAYERKTPPVYTVQKPAEKPPVVTDNNFRKKYNDEYFRRKQETLSGIGDTPSLELRSQQQEVRGIENLPREFRVIGQLFKTYIIVEEGDSMLLIDQHAAHERIKYEELKKQLAARAITPQTLLEPVEVSLSPVELELLTEHSDALLKLGFDSEIRDGKCVVSTVPSPMDEDEIKAVFVELLTALGDGRAEVINKTKERLTYTIACKAAIKANHRFTELEMYSLVREVFELENNINTCPHGRPIVIKMTKKEIEKEFGRTL